MKAPIIITATLFLASCSQASADTYDPWNTPAAESCGLHLAGTAHSHFQLINEDGQEACTTLGVHTVRCHGCDHVVSLADYGCQWIQ